MSRTRVIFILILLAALLIVGMGVLIQRARQKSLASEVERHYQAGVFLQKLEDWPAAEAEFKQVVALDPDYEDTQARLIEIKARQTQSTRITANPTSTATLTPTSTPTPTATPVPVPPQWSGCL